MNKLFILLILFSVDAHSEMKKYIPLDNPCYEAYQQNYDWQNAYKTVLTEVHGGNINKADGSLQNAIKINKLEHRILELEYGGIMQCYKWDKK